MKKKLGRLSALLVVVLCVCLLCVSAFASDETVILPETTFVHNESEDSFLDYELPFVVGQKYKVVWNNVDYSITCSVSDLDGNLVTGLFPDFENPAFPFAVGIFDGVTVFVPVSESALNPDGTFTVSIYGIIPYLFSTTFTPTLQNDGAVTGAGSVPLVEGEKYLCTVNGEELVATAFFNNSIAEGRTLCYLGNIELILPNLGLPSDSSLPFLFVSFETDSGFEWTLVSEHITNEELTFTIGNYIPSSSEQIFSNITTYADSLLTQFSIGSLVEVLAYAVCICVGFVFLWWGVRKAARAIMSAFRKGKLRL